ncbi:hypothetical protein ACVFYP_22395 [Roseomonas sp. F4]
MSATATLTPAGHLALSLREWGVQDHDTHALITLQSRSVGAIYWINDATRLRQDLQGAAAMLEAQATKLVATSCAKAAPSPTMRPHECVILELARERERQIDGEGFALERDDQYDRGELALAAACYAGETGTFGSGLLGQVKRLCWPWSALWWKPTTRRRDLIKAGALIVAEIERLDREAARRVPAR